VPSRAVIAFPDLVVPVSQRLTFHALCFRRGRSPGGVYPVQAEINRARSVALKDEYPVQVAVSPSSQL